MNSQDNFNDKDKNENQNEDNGFIVDGNDINRGDTGIPGSESRFDRDSDFDRDTDEAGKDRDHPDIDEDGPRSYDAENSDEQDLPHLIKSVGRLMRREFLASAAEGGFDPRDAMKMRRARRWAPETDEVVDGAPEREESPWGRGGAEMRERLQAIRDQVETKVEETLSAQEFADLKASLGKIANSLRGDDEESQDFPGDDRGSRRGEGRGEGRGGGRGRRGFGPDFGPAREGFGPGRGAFGPFGRGFGPREDRGDHGPYGDHGFDRSRGFGPHEDHGDHGSYGDRGPRGDHHRGHGRHDRYAENRATEAAFERGFAAGFKRGVRS